jgi:DNA-binding protein HU-beta
MPTNKSSEKKITGKEDIVHLTAGKAKTSMRETQSIIDAFLETVQDEVAQGHQVRLIGFGSWQVRPISARTIKSIRGGTPIHLPAGKRVSFTTGSQLAEAAGSPTRAKSSSSSTATMPSKKSGKK